MKKLLDHHLVHKNKEVIRTAQKLVNGVFETNSDILINGKGSDIRFEHKLKKFQKAIGASSVLTEEDKKVFYELPQSKQVDLARQIVLSLLRREIKTLSK